MGLWLGIIVAAYVIGAGLVVGVLYGRVKSRMVLFNQKVETLHNNARLKREVIKEVADLTLGLAKQEHYDEVNKEISEAEEGLRAEQGRFTITQAERDAVETRLRELEELERELEASTLESMKEVEMLQSQEREIEARNEQLREQLKSAFEQLDMLLGQLESSSEAAVQAERSKAELLETQEKINWYTEEIATLNQKYMDLKTAYDALDIEYAQLYEKQHMLELAAADDDDED